MKIAHILPRDAKEIFNLFALIVLSFSGLLWFFFLKGFYYVAHMVLGSQSSCLGFLIVHIICITTFSARNFYTK